MRIAVDASCFANRRGYGRYTRELSRALVAAAPVDEFLFLADAAAARDFDLSGPNVRLVEVPRVRPPVEAASAAGFRSPLDLLRFTRALARARADVFLSPSVYTFFPLPPGQRAVIALHDAIAERFPELTLPTRRARLFWRAKVRLALAQADLVLTVSDHAARDLERVLGVPRARLRVTGEAPSAEYASETSEAEVAAAARSAGLPEGARWLTYVGGFNPHKNVDLLVEAHAALARSLEAPPHLVLVGALAGDPFHGDQGRIRAAVEREGTRALVHWPGWLDDATLRALHKGSIALVLPSLCEGFGLPAVEAAAAGAPSVATSESPLPEVLQGGGIFVPPNDLGALVSALRTLATDEPRRRALAERARERSRALSWGRAAEVALEALRQAGRR